MQKIPKRHGYGDGYGYGPWLSDIQVALMPIAVNAGLTGARIAEVTKLLSAPRENT